MIGRSWRGGSGGRDEFVSSLRRKRDEFVASRAGDPRVPTQSLVSRFCLTFPGRPRFEALLVRKGASSSLVVDIRESGYTVHVAEWLSALIVLDRSLRALPLTRAIRSFDEGRCVQATVQPVLLRVMRSLPPLVHFRLFLGRRITRRFRAPLARLPPCYNVKVPERTNERRQDEFVVPVSDV